ncbi:sigma-54 dependent transcriptional regulator [uncultured Leclercia sp.]|uniref:sigma-54 interaction domain-containing protein n=1 Tax=uncultured Leclercia sp. TaxID=332959 RepID=UPI002595BEDE|nr:sigma-54 dependent transcriptional regulator [uncultured Leclercia sp.]
MASVMHNFSSSNSRYIACAPASISAFQFARRVAEYDVPALVTGETGTGKECIARTIHQYSVGDDAPYIAVNCAAIPETMLESLLFGYEKGAFTGAVASVPGKFEQANNGVLLLDEIGDMPLALQAKLLRVLQDREVERLGSQRKITLNVRIIAATNRDLLKESAEGRFREDLYYRLAVVPIHIPPLRERQEDILPLARAFITKYQLKQGNPKVLSLAAQQALVSYSWPGNIRELENCIQRGLILCMGDVIEPVDLQLAGSAAYQETSPTSAPSLPGGRSVRGVRGHGRLAEYQYIIDLLKQHNGNKSRTAQSLGITPRALRYRLATMRGDGFDPGCFA